MKAVRLHQFGGPEVLKYEDVPDPQPRQDQVLVRVRACAMNHLDLWVCKGLPGVKLPHILGSDVAGEIVDVGEYVTGLQKGQRVIVAPMVFCGHCRFCASGVHNMCREFTVLGNGVDGGNCELIAARHDYVIPIPDSLSFEEASAVPLVGLTAWHMMVTRAQIRPGQNVLVLGANSGVGMAAIQIGKLFNARVIATAGDEHKMQRARELGADEVINHYTAENFRRGQAHHQQGNVRHRHRARRPGHLGREHEIAQARRRHRHLRRHHRAQGGPSICASSSPSSSPFSAPTWAPWATCTRC